MKLRSALCPAEAKSHQSNPTLFALLLIHLQVSRGHRLLHVRDKSRSRPSRQNQYQGGRNELAFTMVFLQRSQRGTTLYGPDGKTSRTRRPRLERQAKLGSQTNRVMIVAKPFLMIVMTSLVATPFSMFVTTLLAANPFLMIAMTLRRWHPSCLQISWMTKRPMSRSWGA